MDVIEKTVADLLAKLLKITSPTGVATVEAAAPKLVDGVLAVVDVIKAARTK